MRILLCGMGNKERGDDGFGPYVVKNIRETDTIKPIDCHLYPENYLNKITSFDPDVIIFLDTVKKEDAKATFLRNEEIIAHNPISVSTHSLPFSAIYQFLKENSQAEIWFLGVRANSYEKLSDEITTVAHRITNVFNSLDTQKNLDIMSFYEKLSTAIR